MTNAVNKSSGESLYLKASNGTVIKKTYRNELIWDIYNSFDANQNGKLEENEINNFSAVVFEYAGSDKNLSDEEMQQLANRFNVSKTDIMKAMRFASASILAQSLTDTFHPGLFSSVNKSAIKNLVSRINQGNVCETWTAYQVNVDEKFSLRGFLFKDTSLAKDILDNFDFNEAKPMLDKLVSAMLADAKARKIDITLLVQNYNTALSAQDAQGVDAAIREMGLRLNLADRFSHAANVHTEHVGGNTEVLAGNKTRAENIAASVDAPVTPDVIGDGKLGNTKSVAMTGDAKAVLDIVNEMMKDPMTKERFQACMRKERNCIMVQFPNRLVDFTNSENGLVTAGTIEDSVVGDGDMSVFIYGILNEMKEDNFRNFDDKNAIKQYLSNLFTPVLFGGNKIKKT